MRCVIGRLDVDRRHVLALDRGVDAAGLAHDKTSDMATVLMRGRDGRTALLAFTSTETLRRWNADARPVPLATLRSRVVR